MLFSYVTLHYIILYCFLNTLLILSVIGFRLFQALRKNCLISLSMRFSVIMSSMRCPRRIAVLSVGSMMSKSCGVTLSDPRRCVLLWVISHGEKRRGGTLKWSVLWSQFGGVDRLRIFAHLLASRVLCQLGPSVVRCPGDIVVWGGSPCYVSRRGISPVPSSRACRFRQ